jgi:hypothetical protein
LCSYKQVIFKIVVSIENEVNSCCLQFCRNVTPICEISIKQLIILIKIFLLKRNTSSSPIIIRKTDIETNTLLILKRSVAIVLAIKSSHQFYMSYMLIAPILRYYPMSSVQSYYDTSSPSVFQYSSEISRSYLI